MVKPPRPRPRPLPYAALSGEPAIIDYLSDMLAVLESIEDTTEAILTALGPLEDIKHTLARIEARRPIPRRRPPLKPHLPKPYLRGPDDLPVSPRYGAARDPCRRSHHLRRARVPLEHRPIRGLHRRRNRALRRRELISPALHPDPGQRAIYPLDRAGRPGYRHAALHRDGIPRLPGGRMDSSRHLYLRRKRLETWTMTAETPPRPRDPVGYKIPRALRARLHAIRDYYTTELGYTPTLIESLERMTAFCEASYGIKRTPRK